MTVWSFKPLGEVATIAAGNSAPQDERLFADGDVPFFRTSDIGRIRFGHIEVATDYLNDEGARRLRLFPKGTILFPKSGASTFLNHRVMMGVDGCVSSHLATITANAAIAEPRFLLYHLATIQAQDLVQDHAYPSLNLPLIAGLQVPIVSLFEQRRIVAILDEAFEGIATAKANAEKSLVYARDLAGIGYREITESYERAKWPILKVAMLAAAHKGSMRTGPFGSQLLHGEFVDEGVAVLGIDNAVANEFRWDRRRYITAEKYRQLERYRVQPGDVLITIMGTCGRCAVVPQDIPVAINTKHLCCISLDRSRCLPEFLHGYFLHNPIARDYLIARAKGSIMAGLNMGIIAELPVMLPSLVQQEEIVELFETLRVQCSRLEAIQMQKLAALDDLKKSLLHQAFTGQLTSSKQRNIAQQPALRSKTPEFAANVIALAHARHEHQKREKTFGRVKEQKLLHLVEAIAKIDLGRLPMKDAAGPNDFQHMLRAEAWAKAQSFFDMVKRGEGYELRKLSAFETRLSSARQALGPYLKQLDTVIDLLLPMDTEQAEVFATVHAAWNNLLIDGAETTDEAIVSAAREGWHADKLKIPRHKFLSAIELIRQKGLVPDGTAKYVGGQQSLL